MPEHYHKEVITMRVNHNIPALNAYNAVNATTRGLQKSIQKLSTGLRINGASDDAAGLAISEKMRAQVRGMDQAVGNAQDGINMIQTAEGALSETHSILQRMRELSVQAANDTLTANDRSFIQLEIDQLTEEIDRIANTTQFNKKKLLNGDAAVLWSTDNLDTKVNVRGGLRTIDQFGQKSSAEGNFKITIDAQAGTSQIQKTDIFKVKHASTGGGDPVTSRVDSAEALELGEVAGFLKKSEADDVQKFWVTLIASGAGSDETKVVTVTIQAASNMTASAFVTEVAAQLQAEAVGTFAGLTFVNNANRLSVAAAGIDYGINFSDVSANYDTGKKILDASGLSVQMTGAFVISADAGVAAAAGGIDVNFSNGVDSFANFTNTVIVMASGWEDKVTASFNFKDNSGANFGTITFDVKSETSDMTDDAVGQSIVNQLNAQLQASANVNLQNIEAAYDTASNKLTFNLKDELATRDIKVDWNLSGSYESLEYSNVTIGGETSGTGQVRYDGPVATTEIGEVDALLNANQSGGIKGSFVVTKELFNGGTQSFTLDYQMDARSGDQTTLAVLTDLASQLNAQVQQIGALYDGASNKLNFVVSTGAGGDYQLVVSNTLVGVGADYGNIVISAGSYNELGAASNVVTGNLGATFSNFAAVNITVNVGAGGDLVTSDISAGTTLATQLGGDVATATFNFRVGTSVTSVSVDVEEDYTDETAPGSGKALQTLVTELNKELITAGLNDIKAYVGDDGNLAFNTTNASQNTHVNWEIDNTQVTSTGGVGLTINNKTTEAEWTKIVNNYALGGTSAGAVTGTLNTAKNAETLTGTGSLVFQGSTIDFNISVVANTGDLDAAQTLDALVAQLNAGLQGYDAASKIEFVRANTDKIHVRSLTGGDIAAADFTGLTLTLDPNKVKMVENAASDKYTLTLNTNGGNITTAGVALRTGVGAVTFSGSLDGAKEADVAAATFNFTIGGVAHELKVDFKAESSDVTTKEDMANLMASQLNKALAESGNESLKELRAYAVRGDATDWDLVLATSNDTVVTEATWNINNTKNSGTAVQLAGSSTRVTALTIDHSDLAAYDIEENPGGRDLAIGDIAAGDTRIYDIDKFWDSNGNFMVTDPQTITLVQGDGQKTSFTIYQDDTLDEIATKINDSIRDGLNQGILPNTATHSDKFARYIDENDADASAYGSVAGTIVINSAVNGDQGEITFIGDEELVKALSLNQIREAEQNRFTVNIEDAHSGLQVASDVKITGNNLVGVLHENIDIQFNNMADLTVAWDETSSSWEATANAGSSYETIVHLADNTTVFQIGANEKEDMGINIGNMNARALGVNNILVTDRESAARSITVLDKAIDRVSAQRANLGAYQNRLEHTINNLTTATTNITAAESRIRDVDMAKEMMNFTKLNILMQAGNSMLAQANQLPQNVLQLLR